MDVAGALNANEEERWGRVGVWSCANVYTERISREKRRGCFSEEASLCKLIL